MSGKKASADVRPVENAATPAAENQEEKIAGLVKKFRRVLDKRPSTVSKLSKRFDVSKETVIKGLDRLQNIYHEEGYALLVHKKVRGKVERVSSGQVAPEKEFPGFETKFRILVLGHTMLGNKFEQPTLLHTAYACGEASGVKLAVVVGGAIAGKPSKGTEGELFLHDGLEQAAYLANIWPKASFNTYFLAGDEELSGGSNYAEAFCGSGRSDLRYLDAWSRRISIGGSDVQLQFAYPKGGIKRTYTVSYRPQKLSRAVLSSIFPKIRANGSPSIPRVIFSGRTFAQGEINRGMKTVLVPGLVDQTPSMDAAEVTPTIGFLIVEFRFDENGKLLGDFAENGAPQEGGITVDYYDLSSYAKRNDYGDYPKAKNCSPNEEKILGILRERSASMGDLSRRLNCSTESAEQLIASLQEKGYEIAFVKTTKRFVWTPDIKRKFTPLALDLKPSLSFGTTSDIHYGSKHQQPEIIKMIHRYAASVWKAPVMLNGGDNHDGRRVYRGQETEVFAESFDEQLAVSTREWPADPPTIAIAGNHDESFWKAIAADLSRHFKLALWPELTDAADIMKMAAKRLPHLNYLGTTPGMFCTEARVAINPGGSIGGEKSDPYALTCMFVHPRGAAGQFRSLKGQKHLENLMEYALSSVFSNLQHTKRIPHLYLMGNWHVDGYIRYGGVDIYLLPTGQSQTRFLKELGLTPDIGSWMVRTYMDASKTVVRNTVKYLDLIPFVKERDY